VRNGFDPGDAASERLQRAAGAARELSDALWDSLQQELSDASSEHARAIAQRLGEVSSTVALLLGAVRHRQPAPEATEPVGGQERGRHAERQAGDAPASEATPAQPPGADGERPWVERRSPPEPIPPPPDASSFAPGLAEHARGRLVDEQEPATVMPFAPVARSNAEPAEIAVHDVRREEGPAAWISLVGKMLARHSDDHLPFAVLLVEIVDVAHLERSETPHDLHGIVAQVESALGRGMRTTDELSRETLGRYWLLAPDTNGTGARMLAERLAQLVRSSATHRGVPMEVAIGIAVCPEDGVEAPMLAARADLGVYSARATGRPIARTDPPD
jgi:GGDEF domain-containing protein